MTRRGEPYHKPNRHTLTSLALLESAEKVQRAPWLDKFPAFTPAEVGQMLDSVASAAQFAELAKHAPVIKQSANRYRDALLKLQSSTREHAKAGGHVTLSQDVIDKAVRDDQVFAGRAIMLDRSLMAGGSGWWPDVSAAFDKCYSEEELIKLADDPGRAVGAPLFGSSVLVAKEQRSVAGAHWLLRRCGCKITCGSRRNNPWHRLSAILYGDINHNMYRQMREYDGRVRSAEHAQQD